MYRCVFELHSLSLSRRAETRRDARDDLLWHNATAAAAASALAGVAVAVDVAGPDTQTRRP